MTYTLWCANSGKSIPFDFLHSKKQLWYTEFCINALRCTHVPLFNLYKLTFFIFKDFGNESGEDDLVVDQDGAKVGAKKRKKLEMKAEKKAEREVIHLSFYIGVECRM